MKTRLVKFVLFISLFCYCSLAKAVTYTATSFNGTSSAYLSEGASNLQVFGFSVTVPAGTAFNPISLKVLYTGTLNGFVSSASLYRTVGPSTTPSTSGTSIGTANVGSSDITFSSVSSITPSSATTYYYYLYLTIKAVNTAPSTTATVFSISTASNGFAQNYTTSQLAVTPVASQSYHVSANLHWQPTSNTNASWSNTSNWYYGTATAASAAAGRIPTAYDNVYIGVVAYSAYQPTYDGTSTNTSPAAASITFGTAQTVSSNDVSAIKLTVSKPLVVGDNITQTSNYNIPVNTIYLTEIAGTAAVTADNIVIGDGSAATINGTGAAAAVVWSNTSTASIINSDIQINGVYPSGLPQYILAGPATFLLRNGTLTCDRVVLNNATSSSYSSFCLDLSALGFSAVTNIPGTGTIKVMNATPFVKAGQGTTQIVTTTNASTTSTTIEYGGSAQAVLTQPSGTAAAAATQNRYDNVAFSGSGIKTPDGTSSQTMTVGGNFTNSGTSTVNFTTNNPAVTVIGTLNNGNGATIKQGTGNISITGAITNSGTITGNNGTFTALSTFLNNNSATVTLGTGAATITGALTNVGNFTTTNGSGTFTALASVTNGAAGQFTLGTGVAKALILINAGTVTGSSTSGSTLTITGTATVGTPFQNSGTVTCNAENIAVTGPTANSYKINAGTGALTFGDDYTNNSGGQLTCSSGSVTFTGDYTNNSGGTFTAGAGMVYFNGTTQALLDKSTAGTTFNNVTFNGGTATMSSGSTNNTTGNFAISTTGSLNLANNAKLTAGATTVGSAAYLTLLSNGSSSASIGKLSGTSSITGNVNVQRYITGGSSSYRGYRLISSPTNASLTTSGAGTVINLSYLNVSPTIGNIAYKGALTGGPSGFSVVNATPTLYVYDESKATSNTSFTSGKDIGIYDPGTATAPTVTTLTGTTKKPSVSIPAGNGFLLYYVGSTSSTSTASSRVPDAATLTSTGYINQGDVPVKLWSTPTSTSLSFASPTAASKGYNLVGNPYASTIDLDILYTDNAKTYSLFYELRNTGGFVYYDASTKQYSDPTYSSDLIPSGQAFFVKATTTGQTLTFKEDQKVSSQLSTTSTPRLLMGIPVQNSIASSGLHLVLEQDSINTDACGLYFSKDYADSHDDKDVDDMDGISPKVYLSSYTTDNVRTAINSLSAITNNRKTTKLYVNTNTSGLFKMHLADVLSIDTALYDIYLLDHYKKDSLDIGRYKTYNFNVSRTDTNSFGANRFDLVIKRKPLPLYQLISFSAIKAKDGVQLTWKTYNEGNYTTFSVEKQDGEKFSPVYTKQSDGSNVYSYLDMQPVNGVNAYRLLQNDIDNKNAYSSIVSVNYGSSADLFNIYPNPAKTSITVNLNIATNAAVPASYQFTVYNTNGVIVIQKTINSNNWSQDVNQLKPGAYTVEMKSNNGSAVGRSKFLKIN